MSSVRFSPDGRTLGSCSWDRKVGLWDVQKGVLLSWLQGHTSTVTGLHLPARGKSLGEMGGKGGRKGGRGYCSSLGEEVEEVGTGHVSSKNADMAPLTLYIFFAMAVSRVLDHFSRI